MINREKIFELAMVPRKDIGNLAIEDDTKSNKKNEIMFDVNDFMQSSSSLDEHNQSKKRGVGFFFIFIIIFKIIKKAFFLIASKNGS